LRTQFKCNNYEMYLSLSELMSVDTKIVNNTDADPFERFKSHQIIRRLSHISWILIFQQAMIQIRVH